MTTSPFSLKPSALLLLFLCLFVQLSFGQSEKQLHKQGLAAIKAGRLLSPPADNAFDLLKRFPKTGTKRHQQLRQKLVQALDAKTKTGISNYLSAERAAFRPATIDSLLRYLNAARSIADAKSGKSFQARLLFFQALREQLRDPSEKNSDSSLRLLKESLAQEANAAHVYNEMGNIYLYDSLQLDLAERTYQKALSLSAGWKIPRNHLSELEKVRRGERSLDSGGPGLKIIFVKAGADGKGSSWANALGNLQAALSLARPGTQIWVAAGEYRTTPDNNREIAFLIPEGVQMLGGFAGTETAARQRNPERNLCLLSGEIGRPGPEDNAYSVVITRNVSAATIVDGFTIAHGSATGIAAPGDPKRGGGGWFNDGSLGASNPTIINCLFRDNTGFDGAGFYNYAKTGAAGPSLSQCIFVNNKAQLDGGALFNFADQAVCNPLFKSCLFQNNQANYGAGIMNQALNGEARPELRNCRFMGNASLVRGSGVYNNRLENAICAPVLKDCTFEDNIASVGEDYGRSYLALILAAEKPNDTETVLDAAQNRYRTILAGGLIWTQQNMALDIPGESWCYGNQADTCRKYGRLYTWEGARKACAGLGPQWRLPSDLEWQQLSGSAGLYAEAETAKAKASPKKAYEGLVEGGITEFSAVFGGWRAPTGPFSEAGTRGLYWSASEASPGNAGYFYFKGDRGKLNRSSTGKQAGLSCRCVKKGP